MRVCGIDWSTNEKQRAAVILEAAVPAGDVTVAECAGAVSDAQVTALCEDSQLAVVAVDVPFGWPAEFREPVSGWEPRQPLLPAEAAGAGPTRLRWGMSLRA